MLLPRTWTPSITPRTTASLTCWTSATWRAGEGRRAVKRYYLRFTAPRLPFFFFFSRDLAVIVASMAYNTWFTKLYCKDLRIVSTKTASGFTLPSTQVKCLCVSLSPSGVRGHRAGPAHCQQIVQPGGDHSGERGIKIVSFSPFLSSVQSSINSVPRTTQPVKTLVSSCLWL